MAQRREFPQEFDGSVSEIVDGVRRRDSTERCTELDLGGKRIGDSGVSQLCTVLSHFTALEKLWLYGNGITSVGVSELCNVLKLCERLTLLSLGGNSIDDIGAKLIAKTLTDTKLEELYIDNNQIDRDGICALLLSAKNSKTLKQLSIYRNSGVSLALEDIEEILPHYRTLQELMLGLWENDLSEVFRQRIRTVMKRCAKSLKVQLRLDEGWISGSLEFAPALFDSALFHREFLSAVQRCGGVSVYRSRVSFVGDSRVGKTWTAKSLRGEPNFHPQTQRECNAQRTAAAESTALQIGDFAFWDVSQIEESAEVGGTDDEGVGDSEERLPTQSPRENSEQGGNSTATGQGTEADTEDTVQLHDKVLTAPLPDDIPSEEDARKPVCFLTLWDFGGQKMYHSWYQFFFAPGMIPCVVFDLPSVVPPKPRKLTFWQRILPFLRPTPRPVPPVVRSEAESIRQVVDYSLQSLHFGGAGSKVLLIGTQVDCLADSSDGRNRVASEAFQKIVEESPLQLRNRFLQFPPCGSETGARCLGVCSINNDNSKDGVDSGVKILQNSLIQECMRERPPPVVLPSAQGAGSRSGLAEDSREQNARETPDEEDPLSYFQGNRVPVHWYRFELDLRQSDRWKRVDFCSIKELREYSRDDRFKLPTDVEFVAMLMSMSSAGAIVLGAEIPLLEVVVTKVIPDTFLDSVVIIRPQWIIEVGRRLLPRPHDDRFQYSQRLTDFLQAVDDSLVASIEQLWTSGVVDAQLLKPLLGGASALEHHEFECIVQLLESRLILCRTHSEPVGIEDGKWFVPSLVAFHSEYFNIPSAAFRDPSNADIWFTMDFDWLPPGLPMLIVGAMFRDMETQPTYSVAKGTGRIQFVVGIPNHAADVVIDLPNGAGGKTMSIFTELITPIPDSIRKMMQRILDSVRTACALLCVQPLLEKSAKTLERGLVVSFAVPLVREELNSDLSAVDLKSICCRDPQRLPDGCDKNATRDLYRQLLLNNRSAFRVPNRWLGPLAPSTEERPTPDLAAENARMGPNADGNAVTRHNDRVNGVPGGTLAPHFRNAAAGVHCDDSVSDSET